MGVKVTNNSFGTISAGINSSATTVTLDSGQGARFPTLGAGDYFFGTLVDTSNNIEVIKVTARSTDSMTVIRAQDNTSARAFTIGDRFELRPTAALFESIPYDNNTTSTGSLALPKGTTAQQPSASTTEGHIRYDTDDNVVYYSDGTSWIKVSSVIATLSSVTGNIYDGAASTLTLAGTGFMTANLVVNFLQSSDSIDVDVTVTPTSDTAATVSVPASVYNNVTAGNVVSITVTNSDSIESGAVTKTALALPSGGTVTTSGNYRYHKFTSSGTFTNTLSNLAVDYIIAAGGGGSTTYYAGGGGAGGFLAGSTTASATSHTITVGAGGAGVVGAFGSGSNGNNGGNSSALSITATGGGGGGGRSAGASGGSGGGGGNGSTAGGAGTSGQGNAGGSGNGTGGVSNISAGGGGGKGAAGTNGVFNSINGNGGIGTNAYSTWATATSSGDGGYYAGGGAGGVVISGSITVASTGGAGGGGTGGISSGAVDGTNGTANTGGGAGGGGENGGSLGASGGSGIVILRYQL